MKNHTAKIQKKADDFIQWLKVTPGPVNAAEEYEHLAFKIMAFVIFSRDFDDDYLLAVEGREAYKTIRASQHALGTYGHVPWFYSVAQWFPGLIPENAKFNRLANKMVDERRKVHTLG